MATITNATLTQGSSLTVTDNVVTGTGAFDDLMEAVNIHLEAQFNLGRITGSDYATVYLGAMQVALQQSVAFVFGLEKTNAEVTLINQKEITEFGQTQKTSKIAPHADSILGKQATLYGEQAKGFQWNADQKYLKTLLDAWAVNISTAGVASTQVTALNATGTGNINTQITNAEPTG
jgi:thioredoxin-like negative regulator of GroEL